MMLHGGCFCGNVRYEAAGTPFHETSCHCANCRGTTGAPFVAWFSVPRAGFRWLRGEPSRFPSSAEATRTFCSRCGTQLTFEHRAFPDEIDVTIASLDDPNELPPRDHTFTNSALRWIVLADGLPAYRRTRTEG